MLLALFAACSEPIGPVVEATADETVFEVSLSDVQSDADWSWAFPELTTLELRNTGDAPAVVETNGWTSEELESFGQYLPEGVCVPRVIQDEPIDLAPGDVVELPVLLEISWAWSEPKLRKYTKYIGISSTADSFQVEMTIDLVE